MRRLLFVLALIAGSIMALSAQAQTFQGIWDVNTYLTVASGAVNPNYEPGDLRTDVWRIDGSGGQAYLTTKDGTMPGQISGGQAEFGLDVPLDQIIVMRILVAAIATSSSSMKGTISAEYWDRRFGYKVGLDAWTFEALRR